VAGEFFQRIRRDEHFVRVPHDAMPTEIADAIHNFARTGAVVREIASMKNQIRRG
jgi:hypothetical protein